MVPPVRVGHHHPHLSRGVRRAAAPAPTMAPLRTRLLAALLVLALVAGAAGGDPRRGSLLSFYKPVPANTLGMPGGDAPTAPVAPVAVTPPAGEALRAYSACAARGGAPPLPQPALVVALLLRGGRRLCWSKGPNPRKPARGPYGGGALMNPSGPRRQAPALERAGCVSLGR